MDEGCDYLKEKLKKNVNIEKISLGCKKKKLNKRE
jgi:hypothetical protein